MGSTLLPSRRDVSVVSIVYAWPLSAQKECICAHISCSFWFLGYGTRFRMRMSDSETQCLSSHHSTPLFKHLPSGVRRRGERTENVWWCLHIKPPLGVSRQEDWIQGHREIGSQGNDRKKANGRIQSFSFQTPNRPGSPGQG